MTQQQQQSLMFNVFGGMLGGGHFSDQGKMASILKAIHHLLKTQEGLSPQECDDCLLYFFREYGKGCSQPLSDSFIRANMIPVVLGYPTMDLMWGSSILLAAKSSAGIR